MQERPTNASEYSSLPTPKARDHQAEGYEAGLRRASPQVGTILKGLVDGDERVTLLRSPKASEGQGGALGEAEARKRGNTVGVRDQVMDLVASQGFRVSREADNFLPTPNTMEHREIKTLEQIAALRAKSPGGYRNLRESVINELLMMPTPKALDGVKGNLKTSQERLDSGHQVDLPNVAIDLLDEKKTSWGKFEPAIRRWEAILGRPAPKPTKADGKEGAHRLSSSFTEWMMGLPQDWICGHDLKRNDELKLAGNGVVPQQAELALRLLLNSDEE
jgi:hypothetical protein